jgi:glycosyltransferase involved in cell wall biosynthesis
MTQAPRTVLYIVTKSNWGGAQRYVYDLATGLPRGVFEPVVAFGPDPAGNGAGNGQGALGAMLSAAGVRTVLVPELARDVSGDDVHAFFALWRLMRQERPSEVHLNSSKAAGLGALAARLSGVQHIIYTAHGWPFYESRPIFARIAIFLLSYLTVLLAHDTIVLSQRDRRVMARMPFAARRIHVISNGIDTPSFVDRTEARVALLPGVADDAALWIGSIGELTANKDYVTAIAAVAAANASGIDLRYVIIGAGEEQDAITVDIAARGLAGCIHLLGTVPEARTLLKAFDIFLLTSYKEGLPYVVLEAGAAALPVIASEVGGIPEVMENGVEGILCPAGDAAAFAAAITKLAHDADRRATLGAALAQKVRANHDISRMRLQTYKLY